MGGSVVSATEGLHVVVLAAGRGSRMRGVGDDTAKWLLQVGRRRIADRQVEAVRSAEQRSGLAGFSVVTGHAAAGVQEFAREQGVGVVHNERYLEANNWFSVLLALDAVPGDGRVVVMNGDLCARPEWLAAFLDAAAETTSDSLMAVDFARTLTDESMKVAAAPGPDGERVLTRIGKVDVPDPVGEYVGLLMFGGSVRKAMTEQLRAFDGFPAHLNEWYEGAVGRTAAAGTTWTLWGTPDSEWFEIDDEQDHAAAVTLLGDS